MDDPDLTLEEMFPYEYRVPYPMGDEASLRRHRPVRQNSIVMPGYLDYNLWYLFPPYWG